MVQLDMESILEIVVQQNEDIQDYTERTLGEKMSDEIMEQVIEQEVVQVIQRRIEEALNDWESILKIEIQDIEPENNPLSDDFIPPKIPEYKVVEIEKYLKNIVTNNINNIVNGYPKVLKYIKSYSKICGRNYLDI